MPLVTSIKKTRFKKEKKGMRLRHTIAFILPRYSRYELGQVSHFVQFDKPNYIVRYVQIHCINHVS